MKRRGEISQMFYPNLGKNKSYYMNFKHKIRVICIYNSINRLKVQVVPMTCFFISLGETF